MGFSIEKPDLNLPLNLPWDRIRHPWGCYVRLAMALILPFIVWSHDLLLIFMLIVAILSHPYWFPVYKKKAKKKEFTVRLIDSEKAWLENATSMDKAVVAFPAIVMALPLLCFLWTHDLPWTLFFFAGLVGYKILLATWLLKKKKEPDF